MKKYDYSLFVRNNDGVMEEEKRVKTNNPKYLYEKLVKCQMDESGNIYQKYYFNDVYYKNNKSNQVLELLEYDKISNEIWGQEINLSYTL